MRALTDLVSQGKVCDIGSSTFPPSAVVEAQAVAERRGHARFVSEQPPDIILVRAIDLRKQRDQLRAELRTLRRELTSAKGAQSENQSLRRLLAMERSTLSSYEPVTARVIGRSPTVWHATINIDRGRVDGVRVNQPVVSGDGLVGKVTTVTRGAAQVTLLTDHTSGVSAKIFITPADPDDPSRSAYGLVQAPVGRPNDLRLEFLSRRSDLQEGDRVVTAGTRSNRLESLFPPGIPIGSVTRVDDEELAQFQRVHIAPYADLRELDFVQVLTQRAEGATASWPRRREPLPSPARPRSSRS